MAVQKGSMLSAEVALVALIPTALPGKQQPLTRAKSAGCRG